MAKILITGGTGLLGGNLSDLFTSNGHQVRHLSRKRNLDLKYPAYQWDVSKGYIEEEAFEGVDILIHLAGAGVADKRWTSARKEEILKSRTESGKLLFEHVQQKGIKLEAFISASAIGIYGADTGDQWLTEEAMAADDFLADVVKQWEATADLFQSLTRVSKIRIGVVLSTRGGAMPQIMQPINFLVGAPLGSGSQYMSWIHINDLSRIFLFLLDNKLVGTYNAVAPAPVTNEAFTKSLAKAMNKPLFLPNVPGLVMRLMLGEMAQIVLGGNRVSSERVVAEGFNFNYPELSGAIKDLLKTK